MAAAVCLLITSCATAKVPYEQRKLIAVPDFIAGSGVDSEQVSGLSNMLIESLNRSGKFRIMARTQLNRVLEEYDLQQTDLIGEKAIEFGKMSGAEALVIGTVTFIPTGRTLYQKATGVVEGEYNLDVQVIDCTTGEILTAAGATTTKTYGRSYRSLIEKIGKEIGKKFTIATTKTLKIEEQGGEPEWIIHKVNEPLSSIAKKYKVEAEDIMIWNDLKSRTVSYGQKLRIYTKVKVQENKY